MMTTKSLSRRHVLAAGGSTAGFMLLPAHVLGRGGAIPPSNKLNIGFIGIGCRGEVSIKQLASQNIVALCDCDWRPIPNYQWGRACDVAPQYPQAKRYDDWRIMLQEQDKNIDAVVVATADHVHAIAAITAMKMGKHVYCEKPLAPTVNEVRAMMAAERRYKVTTQLGNQGHSSDDACNIVEWIRDGAIGDVKEVHLFLNIGGGPGRPQNRGGYEEVLKRVKEDHPVPPEMKWDLWLGPAPVRPFNPMYAPNSWRRWLDFGAGGLGDFNCHYLDAAYWALDLGLPEKIEADVDEDYDPKTNTQTYANSAEIRFHFAARGKKPPVVVTWHLARGTPPLPKGWKPEDKLPPGGGGIIYGSKGAILHGPLYDSQPARSAASDYKPANKVNPVVVKLFPEELDKEYRRPAPTIRRPPGHWMDWAECAKARKPAGSHFGYGGPLTIVGSLGNIACRLKGQILYYDGKNNRFKNNDEANKLLGRPCRDGWKLPV